MKIDKYKFSINLESNPLGKLVKSLPLLSFSDKLKKGLKEEIELRDGLKVVVNEYKLKRNVSVDFSIKNAPLEFGFCLSGKMNIEVHSESGFSSYLEISSGNCSIFYLPHSSGTIRFSANEDLKILSIHVSPDYLREFVGDDSAGFPSGITDSIWGTNQSPFILTSKMKPNMTLATDSIIQNVFSGSPRNMFIEGKALELMTLIIANISDDYKKSYVQELSADEKARIIEIAEFIENNLSELPSLNSLASKAKMTHTRLNRLFKELFGHTVFSYARELRLEKSKQLLAENKRITEITFILGFSSPAHFSRDFKDRFSVNPKEYQQTLKKHNNMQFAKSL